MRPPLRRDTPGVGILSNEFFDPELGRMGGFGWAARASADCLASRPELGYAPLFLAGEGEIGRAAAERRSNGVPLFAYEDTAGYRRAVRARAALVLTIDYRPNFLPVLESLTERPVLVWVRDPRTAEDHDKIATLRLPGTGSVPAGIAPIDCTSLASFVERVRAQGGRVVVTATAELLAREKAPGAYGLAEEPISLLPNPLAVVPDAEEGLRPSVVFLGRLDPIKRPWVFAELARRFPQVDFLVLGRSHFSGEGTWEPSPLPENVRLLGHVDGDEKHRVLASAWALVNTSIHEGLAVSFLEALHHGTPIVSCQDPESVVTRFGRYVGRWDGDGFDGLDAFSDALAELVDDADLRRHLGFEGRDWVRATHTRERFVSGFARLAES